MPLKVTRIGKKWWQTVNWGLTYIMTCLVYLPVTVARRGKGWGDPMCRSLYVQFQNKRGRRKRVLGPTILVSRSSRISLGHFIWCIRRIYDTYRATSSQQKPSPHSHRSLDVNHNPFTLKVKNRSPDGKNGETRKNIKKQKIPFLLDIIRSNWWNF